VNSDVKTFGLKLSELRPCHNCGGPMAPAADKAVEVLVKYNGPQCVG